MGRLRHGTLAGGSKVLRHAALGLVLSIGCARAHDDAYRRLFEDAETATLGHETRLAGGSYGIALVARGFRSPDDLPRVVDLPAEAAAGEWVALHYEAWTLAGRAPRPEGGVRRKTVVSAVERPATGAHARLAGLRRFAGGLPLRLRVTAFPVPDDPETVLRFPVTLPRDAVLEFGYGVREESWVPGASPTRFRVSLRGESEGDEELFSRILDPGEPDHRRWFDARVDLAHRGASKVELAFTTTRLAGGTAFDLPVWSEPIVYSPTVADERPSFLVISIDTLRARSLGAYGYVRDTSPFIDGLAEAGTLFENAITTSVTTAPSHMSLFTGLYPVHHGVLGGLEPKAASATTLAERLRELGYRTAAFTENGYLVRKRGIGSGFEEYTENVGGRSRIPGQVRLTLSQAGRWLAKNRRTPFFLFVHTYQVHSPYEPPAPYAGSFAGDGAPGPQSPALRRSRDDYDREIRYVDDEVRKLFAALEAAGLERSTIAVVVSDHGEEFGEHGLVQHGAALFEESLRVPLIFWGPGRVPAGRRLAAQVSLVDVAPTLLELAGEAVPPNLDGTSLKGAIVAGEAIEPRTLFAEARGRLRWKGPGQPEPWNPPLIALRSQTSKFIVHRPASGRARPTLRFDLVADEAERAPQRVAPDRERELQLLVDEYLEGVVPSGDRLPDDVDPDLRERLRQLGYVE
jgi:arylsulfatase A-like enzyme